jgi:hypothetical protein
MVQNFTTANIDFAFLSHVILTKRMKRFTFITDWQKTKINNDYKPKFMLNLISSKRMIVWTWFMILCLIKITSRMFPQTAEVMLLRTLYYERKLLPSFNFHLIMWPMFGIVIWVSKVKLRTSKNFCPTCHLTSGKIHFSTPLQYMNLAPECLWTIFLYKTVKDL